MRRRKPYHWDSMNPDIWMLVLTVVGAGTGATIVLWYVNRTLGP